MTLDGAATNYANHTNVPRIAVFQVARFRFHQPVSPFSNAGSVGIYESSESDCALFTFDSTLTHVIMADR